MKKRFVLVLLTLLACLLSACSSGDSDDSASTDTADGAIVDEAAQGADSDQSMPEVGEDAAAVPTVDVADYSYNTFTIESNGFYMEYPSHWERQPASRSVYFLQPVNDGLIPGRIVVTSKTVEEIVETTRENQLRSYFSNILADFDTYEWSDIYTSQAFMGDEEALSVTYTAGKDGALYKGYVILGARGKTLYVYHFRCAETDYTRMQPVMTRVRDSIKLTPN